MRLRDSTERLCWHQDCANSTR